jgi:hypothetical protein
VSEKKNKQLKPLLSAKPFNSGFAPRTRFWMIKKAVSACLSHDLYQTEKAVGKEPTHGFEIVEFSNP